MWPENEGEPGGQDDFPSLVHFFKILFCGSHGEGGGGKETNRKTLTLRKPGKRTSSDLP